MSALKTIEMSLSYENVLDNFKKLDSDDGWENNFFLFREYILLFIFYLFFEKSKLRY